MQTRKAYIAIITAACLFMLSLSRGIAADDSFSKFDSLRDELLSTALDGGSRDYIARIENVLRQAVERCRENALGDSCEREQAEFAINSLNSLKYRLGSKESGGAVARTNETGSADEAKVAAPVLQTHVTQDLADNATPTQSAKAQSSDTAPLSQTTNPKRQSESRALGVVLALAIGGFVTAFVLSRNFREKAIVAGLAAFSASRAASRDQSKGQQSRTNRHQRAGTCQGRDMESGARGVHALFRCAQCNHAGCREPGCSNQSFNGTRCQMCNHSTATS